MRKPFKFRCDLYSQDLFFCPGLTEDEVNASIKEQFEFDSDVALNASAKCFEILTNDGDHGIYIWTEGEMLTIQTASSLAHECMHAISYLFERRGIKYDANNDEPAAYLMGWLMRTMLRHLDEKANPIE